MSTLHESPPCRSGRMLLLVRFSNLTPLTILYSSSSSSSSSSSIRHRATNPAWKMVAASLVVKPHHWSKWRTPYFNPPIRCTMPILPILIPTLTPLTPVLLLCPICLLLLEPPPRLPRIATRAAAEGLAVRQAQAMQRGSTREAANPGRRCWMCAKQRLASTRMQVDGGRLNAK